MGFALNDTIAAIASAPGPGLRGIIRVSGRDMAAVLQQALDTRESGWSNGPARGEPISIPLAQGTLQLRGELLVWPKGRSFTGEPMAELHLPGAPPLLNEVLERILVSGARPAERGEFTLRAFLACRIDLVQAEAVLGVIDAGSDVELRTALGQLAGGISHRIGAIREQLLLHLADLEAGLDFVEEDIEFVAREELTRRLDDAMGVIRELLLQTSGRMQSTGRWRVVLAGLPNAGKSRLFNRLAGREAAIVSHIAGTTRDYLSVVLSHQGLTWELVDTAGWESARDEIEATAGRLRDDQYQRADLVVWCQGTDLPEDQRPRDRELSAECASTGRAILRILTKGDLLLSEKCVPGNEFDLHISAEQGTGVEELLNAIAARLSTASTASEIISSTAARCAESLRHAGAGLARARQLVNDGAGDELIAMELREVLDHLGRIVGQVYTDDILDRIFSRFCIGK